VSANAKSALVLIVLTSVIGLALLVAPVVRPAPDVQAARPAGIGGQGRSTLTVVNMSAVTVETTVDFFRQGNGEKVSVDPSPIPPLSSINVDPAQIPAVSNGAYAAVITAHKAEQQIGALARTVWSQTGGEVAVEQAFSSHDDFLPFVVKHYQGQDSLICIQNADRKNNATVAVGIFAAGSSIPLKTLTVAIMPGASVTLDLGYDAQFADIPDAFVGNARITSSATIAAEAIVDVASTQMGVHGFEGFPAENAARTLVAPLVNNGRQLHPGLPGSPSRSTTLALANTEAFPTTAKATFYGSEGVCAGQVFTKTVSIPASSSAMLDMAMADPPLIPGDCVASAVITSVPGKIVGTAVDSVMMGLGPSASPGYYIGSYNLSVLDEAGNHILVPDFHRAAAGRTTTLHLMNASAATATAMVALFDQNDKPIDGCGDACTVSIAPNSTTAWSTGPISSIPGVIDGHALVFSVQPLVVVVEDQSDDGQADLTLVRAAANDSPAFLARQRQTDVALVPFLSVGPGAVPPTNTPPATVPPEPTVTPQPTPSPLIYLPRVLKHYPADAEQR
jgi:hypothetical protein